MGYRLMIRTIWLILALLTSCGTPAMAQSYDRSEFGSGWLDADRDCQNTRAEMLIELSVAANLQLDPSGCRVVRGKWVDPYTDRTFTDAADVDIDHLVPLEWAWAHGANAWTPKQRRDFANNPANLIPTDDATNSAKGSKGPDQWLPPNLAYRCQYVLRFERIALQHKLMKPAEAGRMKKLRMSVCGS